MEQLEIKILAEESVNYIQLVELIQKSNPTAKKLLEYAVTPANYDATSTLLKKAFNETVVNNLLQLGKMAHVKDFKKSSEEVSDQVIAKQLEKA